MDSAWVWVAVRCGECLGNLPGSRRPDFCLPADAQAGEARAATGSETLLGCGYQCVWEAHGHAAGESGITKRARGQC